jgi:hypothetical protein
VRGRGTCLPRKDPKRASEYGKEYRKRPYVIARTRELNQRPEVIARRRAYEEKWKLRRRLKRQAATSTVSPLNKRVTVKCSDCQFFVYRPRRKKPFSCLFRYVKIKDFNYTRECADFEPRTEKLLNMFVGNSNVQ